MNTSTRKHQFEWDDKITKRKRQYCLVQNATINIVTTFFILASIIPLSTAQDLKICSCSPLTYYMKLDFSKAGCPLGVSDNIGLEGSTCFYTELDPDHDNDFKPVVITDLSFAELDRSLAGIKVLNKFDTRLEDGDIVEYGSVTSNNINVTTGGLHGTFRAINQANHSFTLNFILKFSYH